MKFTGTQLENLQAQLDEHPLPMWLVNANSYAHLYGNRAALEKFGFSLEQFQSLLLTEYPWCTDPSEPLFRMRSREGQLLVFELHWKALELDGESIYWVTGHDVTQYKANEKALQESNRYEQLVARLSSPFVVGFDLDSAIQETLGYLGEYTGASRTWVAMIREEDQIMDNTHEWCAPGVEPTIQDSQNLEVSAFPWALEALTKRGILQIPDVSEMPVEASSEQSIMIAQDTKSFLALPLLVEDRLTGFVGFDNTTLARVWSEAEVSALSVFSDRISTALAWQRANSRMQMQSAALNAAANSIMILDPQGRIEWVNEAFLKMSGYSLAETLSRDPQDLIRSDAHPASFYAELEATLKAGKVWSGEVVNRRKDGSQYLEEQTITPVFAESGEVTHFVAIKQDVSQRKEMEKQLHRSDKLEAISRLAGSIAHDFNNRLQIIHSHAEIALESPSIDDEVRDGLQQILVATRRSGKLAMQLMAFAREQPTRPLVLDLNQAVGQVMDTLHRLVGSDIRVKWEPQPDLDAVQLDPLQLEQILVDLVLNSRDAVAEAGGLITIATGKTAHSVTLVVSDNGCGIPQENFDRLFEPFFSTKPQGEGTGLGLPTVYGIVHQNQGTIDVTSQVGEGTQITISFPRYAGSSRQ